MQCRRRVRVTRRHLAFNIARAHKRLPQSKTSKHIRHDESVNMHRSHERQHRLIAPSSSERGGKPMRREKNTSTHYVRDTQPFARSVLDLAGIPHAQKRRQAEKMTRQPRARTYTQTHTPTPTYDWKFLLGDVIPRGHINHT